MKQLLKFVLALGLFAFMLSCEKVIDVPLNDGDRRIIVEAVGRNFDGESYVLLSMSGAVYNQESGYDPVIGASVSVTDGDGLVSIFNEDPLNPGTYLNADFATLPNKTYDLSIAIDGEISLSAQSQTMNMPVLDSLNYIPLVGGGFAGGGTDTSYLVFYSFVDDPYQTNFYRIRPFVNGKGDDNFYLNNDRLSNGEQITAPIFGTDVEPGDTVLIELISMDEGAYDYLSTLSSALTSGAFSAAPANPVSNIEGDAIGYSGMYLIDTLSIIMPE